MVYTVNIEVCCTVGGKDYRTGISSFTVPDPESDLPMIVASILNNLAGMRLKVERGECIEVPRVTK